MGAMDRGRTGTGVCRSGLLLATALLACATPRTGQPPPENPPSASAPSPVTSGEARVPQHEHAHAAASGSAFASLESLARGAQLFPDLGTYHRPVRTSSQEAQAYFDQGLRLAYGFNHDEAARSF